MSKLYAQLGLPDQDARAFNRRANGQIAAFGKASAPPAPNYTAAAQATAQGNLQAAQQATSANRVNQYTPYGNSIWNATTNTDQNGYDQALSAYQASASPGHYESVTDGDGNTRQQWVNGTQPTGTAPKLSDYQTQNWSNTVSLSPQEQANLDQQAQIQKGLFGAQNNALQQLQQMQSTPLSSMMSDNPEAGVALKMSDLPAMGTPLQYINPGAKTYDPNTASQQATDLQLQLLAPQIRQREQQQASALANQGIGLGSQAYTDAMTNQNNSINNLYDQAALAGINTGMQQQAQQYGQETGNIQLQNQEQQQQFGQTNANNQLYSANQNQAFNQANAANQLAFQQKAYMYNAPTNNLSALMNGSQVQSPTFNSFVPQQATAGADYSGAAQNQYGAALGNVNAQNAAMGGLTNGLFSLGGAALGAPGSSVIGKWLTSDRRLKHDVQLLGKAQNGLNVYSYRYLNDDQTHVGHMADEVEKVFPEAIHYVDGYARVDYSKV
jgi:hypothetical protein